MGARCGLRRLLTAALALAVTACSAANTADSTDAAAQLTGLIEVAPQAAPTADRAAPGGPRGETALDAIFSGPADDGDFNSLGAAALAAAAERGIRARYVPSVAVPEAERTLRALADGGPAIIWAHGSQFYEAAAVVAADYPEVAFIGEAYGRPASQPANMWVLDAQFYLGFYALGAMAAALTETGVIGYVSGVRLPFTFSEVHAVRQAVADAGSDASVRAVWTGDFNDPDKAAALTTSLIHDGADVILGALNNGAVGVFRAAAAAKAVGSEVWVTAKYTDKSGLDTAGVYAGALRTDFTPPLLDVVAEIDGGVRSGYRPFEFNGGVDMAASASIPSAADDAMRRAMDEIAGGSVTVAFDSSPVTE